MKQWKIGLDYIWSESQLILTIAFQVINLLVKHCNISSILKNSDMERLGIDLN